MKKYGFTFIILLATFLFRAQNLVPNGGFERWEKGIATGWEDFAWTPDYIHVDMEKMWYDLHQCGEKIGKGFLGLANSEVTGTKLDKPLEKNKEYIITIYAQRPESFCPAGISTVHVAFTVNKLPKKQGLTIEPYKAPFITLYSSGKKVIKDRCRWVAFSGVYRANGNEAWFYIGGSRAASAAAKPKKDTLVTEASMDKSECLYMNYDSVVVKELSTKPFVLDGIYFEIGKSTLQPASFPSLDRLFDYAQTCASYKLKISGHTDNAGDTKKNLLLSKQRAESVVAYLVKKGIPKTRLLAEGCGDTKPVADNASEEGKAKNRRVEVELVN
jgi:outer membrane protein OmpA-like peptidoglycan-associated protein